MFEAIKRWYQSLLQGASNPDLNNDNLSDNWTFEERKKNSLEKSFTSSMLENLFGEDNTSESSKSNEYDDPTDAIKKRNSPHEYHLPQNNYEKSFEEIDHDNSDDGRWDGSNSSSSSEYLSADDFNDNYFETDADSIYYESSISSEKHSKTDNIGIVKQRIKDLEKLSEKKTTQKKPSVTIQSNTTIADRIKKLFNTYSI